MGLRAVYRLLSAFGTVISKAEGNIKPIVLIVILNLDSKLRCVAARSELSGSAL